MLTGEDNALLTHVDPGTPIHTAFKRYWLPAARSVDLAGKDSDPMRLTLLCENYVMFCDSAETNLPVARRTCCRPG